MSKIEEMWNGLDLYEQTHVLEAVGLEAVGEYQRWTDLSDHEKDRIWGYYQLWWHPGGPDSRAFSTNV
jgi:hypothetical protein